MSYQPIQCPKCSAVIQWQVLEAFSPEKDRTVVIQPLRGWCSSGHLTEGHR